MLSIRRDVGSVVAFFYLIKGLKVGWGGVKNAGLILGSVKL